MLYLPPCSGGSLGDLFAFFQFSCLWIPETFVINYYLFIEYICPSSYV